MPLMLHINIYLGIFQPTDFHINKKWWLSVFVVPCHDFNLTLGKSGLKKHWPFQQSYNIVHTTYMHTAWRLMTILISFLGDQYKKVAVWKVFNTKNRSLHELAAQNIKFLTIKFVVNIFFLMTCIWVNYVEQKGT